MASNNLITAVFNDDELSRTDSAMTEIENIIRDKAVNLTPKQRRSSGRAAYESKVWVDKAYDHMKQYPQPVPSYIDMNEHR